MRRNPGRLYRLRKNAIQGLGRAGPPRPLEFVHLRAQPPYGFPPLCCAVSGVSQPFFPPDIIEPSFPMWRRASATEDAGRKAPQGGVKQPHSKARLRRPRAGLSAPPLPSAPQHSFRSLLAAEAGHPGLKAATRPPPGGKPGMLRSTMAISGIREAAISTASRPFDASPHTVHSGCRSNNERPPRRITWWSSASVMCSIIPLKSHRVTEAHRKCTQNPLAFFVRRWSLLICIRHSRLAPHDAHPAARASFAWSCAKV